MWFISNINFNVVSWQNRLNIFFLGCLRNNIPLELITQIFIVKFSTRQVLMKSNASKIPAYTSDRWYIDTKTHRNYIW